MNMSGSVSDNGRALFPGEEAAGGSMQVARNKRAVSVIDAPPTDFGSKRLRRPSCAAIRMSCENLTIPNNRDLRKYEKKRPTLRFSEMIRQDWTTFSRDKAGLFDDVELAVYGPWRALQLSASHLDHFGVSSDTLNSRRIMCTALKSRKSTWTPKKHKMYHGQLTPASMRVLFDALRFVSQASEILRVADAYDTKPQLQQVLKAAVLFWAATVYALRWKLERNNEYQKPPRSKSQKGVCLDDVKELQVRVKLDHPVLEQAHWHRLYQDMKAAEADGASSSIGHLPADIGLDQSRMLVIQTAILCTSFMLHTSDALGGHGINPLQFPRHDCEKDLRIDTRSLTHVVLASALSARGE